MKNNSQNYSKDQIAEYRGKYLGKDLYVCPICSRYQYETPDSTCPNCKTVVVYQKKNKTEHNT